VRAVPLWPASIKRCAASYSDIRPHGKGALVEIRHFLTKERQIRLPHQEGQRAACPLASWGSGLTAGDIAQRAFEPCERLYRLLLLLDFRLARLGVLPAAFERCLHGSARRGVDGGEIGVDIGGEAAERVLDRLAGRPAQVLDVAFDDVRDLGLHAAAQLPPPQPEGERIAILALLALLAIGAALAAWLLSEMVRHGSSVAMDGMHSGFAVSRRAPLPAEPQRTGLTAANLVLDLVLAAVAFGAFAFAFVMFADTRWDFLGFGRRRRRPRLAGALAEALNAGAADLADDCDPRRAVIACYRRSESAIATVEHRRYPWQTPREYVQAALGALSLPAAAVASLLEIFERARFSELPIMARHRDAALAALGAIRAALEETSTHGTRR